MTIIQKYVDLQNINFMTHDWLQERAVFEDYRLPRYGDLRK